MGRNKAEQWKVILLNELDNNKSPLCLPAVKAVGEYKLTEAGFLLIKLTQSPDRKLVKESILSLSKIKFKKAYNAIKKLSTSNDEEIQKIAMDILENWHSEYSSTDHQN